MAELLTPAKMIAAYGAYYKTGTVQQKDLYKQLFATTDFAKFFNTLPTDDTRIDNTNMVMGRVLQAFSATFASLGSLDFVPQTWYLDRVKINVEMKPDVLAQTALAFLAQKGVERKGAPIIALVAEYLILKAQEDKELEEIFKGEGQTVGNTNPGKSMTGIRKKIRDYYAANKIPAANKITLGAVPTDPVAFVEYVEDFQQALPENIREKITDLALSPARRRLFQKGMREKYNQHYNQAGDLTQIIDTNVTILGFEAMTGSDLMFFTPKANRVGFIKGASNRGVFDLGVKDIYQVQMATDWYEGYDFINPAWVYTNDQDLVAPAP